MSKATLAGGCFWCLEAVFQQLRGVTMVKSGFSGGKVKNPSYKQVCEGNTGHAESVMIHYDEKIIKYPDLLEVFFNIHDPTTLNRQGNDIGEHYRSAIFYHNQEQKEYATAYIKQIENDKIFNDKIVTQIIPFEEFFPAETYHDNYYNLNKEQGYCQYVIQPKVNKFQKNFMIS